MVQSVEVILDETPTETVKNVVFVHHGHLRTAFLTTLVLESGHLEEVERFTQRNEHGTKQQTNIHTNYKSNIIITQ